MARVNVRCWQETYRGLMSDAVLDDPTLLATRERFWTAALTDERYRENRVAVAEGFGEGETEWAFAWFAPSEPVAATLHIAMLDGDGASDPEVRFIDPLSDDVATMTVRLCPVGQDCPPPADRRPHPSARRYWIASAPTAGSRMASPVAGTALRGTRSRDIRRIPGR